jgi:hypothetical protein
MTSTTTTRRIEVISGEGEMDDVFVRIEKRGFKIPITLEVLHGESDHRRTRPHRIRPVGEGGTFFMEDNLILVTKCELICRTSVDVVL